MSVETLSFEFKNIQKISLWQKFLLHKDIMNCLQSAQTADELLKLFEYSKSSFFRTMQKVLQKIFSHSSVMQYSLKDCFDVKKKLSGTSYECCAHVLVGLKYNLLMSNTAISEKQILALHKYMKTQGRVSKEIESMISELV